MTSAISLLPSTLWRDVREQDFDRAVRVVSDSGIAELVDGWIAESRGGSRRGRPRRVTTEAIFVGLFLTVTSGRPPLLTEIAHCLNHLSDTQLKQLGMAPGFVDDNDYSGRGNKARESLYRTVRSAFGRILAETEPIMFPKNRQLQKTEWAEIVRSAGDEAFRRRSRLEQLSNAIIEMSFQMMNRKMRRSWRGSVAVDGTKIPSCARGTSGKSTYMSTDPTAGFHVRDGDHADPSSDTATGLPAVNAPATGARKRGQGGYAYAHEATLVVMTPDSPDDDRTFPLLVVGMTLDRPGHDPAGNAIRALNSIKDRDHPQGWLAGDLAYMPNSKPENFQIPARTLGYELVFDYRADQLGIQTSHRGAIMVEGSWYCPAMPAALVSATRDLRTHKIDEPTWQARIKSRGQYLVRPTTVGSSSGSVAMRCPAANPAPTLRCGLKVSSLEAKKGIRRILVIPDNPDVICTNKKTVNFSPDVGSKYWQKLPYGSPKWQSTYRLMRSVIEGFNGFVKDSSNEGLGDPTRRRVRGLAAQSILCSFLILAANIRKIRSFIANATEQPDGSLKLPPSTKRVDYTVITHRTSGTDPPEGIEAA